MAIGLTTNFTIGDGSPVDDRIVVGTQTAPDGSRLYPFDNLADIPEGVVYRGLLVYDNNQTGLFIYEGDTGTNVASDWNVMDRLSLNTAFGENITTLPANITIQNLTPATYDAGVLAITVHNDDDILAEYADLVHARVPSAGQIGAQTINAAGYNFSLTYVTLNANGTVDETVTATSSSLTELEIDRSGTDAVVSLTTVLTFEGTALTGTPTDIVVTEVSLNSSEIIDFGDGITIEDFGPTRVYFDQGAGNLSIESGYTLFENENLEYNPHDARQLLGDNNEISGLNVSGLGVSSDTINGKIFSYNVQSYPEYVVGNAYSNGDVVIRITTDATQIWRSERSNNTTTIPVVDIPVSIADWTYLGHTVRSGAPTGRVEVTDLHTTSQDINGEVVVAGNTGVRLTRDLTLNNITVNGRTTIEDSRGANEAVTKSELDTAVHNIENKLGGEISELTRQLNTEGEQQAIDDRFTLVDESSGLNRTGHFVGTTGYRQYSEGSNILRPIQTFTAYRRGTRDRPDVSTDLTPSSPHPDLARNYPNRSEITSSNQIDWTAVYSAALNNDNLGPSDYYEGTTAASRHLPELVDIRTDAALAAATVSQLEADTDLILDGGVRSYASRYLNNNSIAQNIWDHRIVGDFSPTQGFEHYRGHEDAIQVLNKIGGYYKPQLSATTNVNFGNRDSNDSANSSSHGFNVSFKWINADGFDYNSYHPLFSVYGGPEQSNENLSSEFSEFPRFEIAYIPRGWDGTGFRGDVYDSFGGRVRSGNTFDDAGQYVILATRPRDRDRGGNRQSRIIPLPSFNGDVSQWDGTTFCSVSFTFFEDENFSESGIGNEGERDLRVIKCRMSLYELSQNGIWYNRISSHDNNSGLLRFNLQAVNQRTISELRVDQDSENGVWNRTNPILSFGLGSVYRLVPANNNELLDIPPLGFITDININHAPVTKDSGRNNSGRYRNDSNNLTFDHFNNPGTVTDFTDGYNHILARRGTREIHAVNIDRGIFRNLNVEGVIEHNVRRNLPIYNVGEEDTAGEWVADVLNPQTNLTDNARVWDIIQQQGFEIESGNFPGAGLHIMTIPHDVREEGVEPQPRTFFDTSSRSTFESAEIPAIGERFTEERQHLIERVTGTSTTAPREIFTQGVETVDGAGNENLRDITFRFGGDTSNPAINFNQIEEAEDLTAPDIPIFIFAPNGEEVPYQVVGVQTTEPFVLRVRATGGVFPQAGHSIRIVEYATSFVARSDKTDIARSAFLNEYFEDDQFPDRVFSRVHLRGPNTSSNSSDNWQYVFVEANDVWDRIDSWPVAFDENAPTTILVTGDRYSQDGHTYTYTGTGATIDNQTEYDSHIPSDNANIWTLVDDILDVYSYRGGQDGLVNFNSESTNNPSDILESRSRWNLDADEINSVYIPQFRPMFTSDGHQLTIDTARYHIEARFQHAAGTEPDVVREYVIQPTRSNITFGLIGISRRFNHRIGIVDSTNFVYVTDGADINATADDALDAFITAWEANVAGAIQPAGTAISRNDIVEITYFIDGTVSGVRQATFTYEGIESNPGSTGELEAQFFVNVTDTGVPIPSGYDTEPMITVTNRRYITGRNAPIELHLNSDISIDRHEVRVDEGGGNVATLNNDVFTIRSSGLVNLEASDNLDSVTISVPERAADELFGSIITGSIPLTTSGTLEGSRSTQPVGVAKNQIDYIYYGPQYTDTQFLYVFENARYIRLVSTDTTDAGTFVDELVREPRRERQIRDLRGGIISNNNLQQTIRFPQQGNYFPSVGDIFVSGDLVSLGGVDIRKNFWNPSATGADPTSHQLEIIRDPRVIGDEVEIEFRSVTGTLDLTGGVDAGDVLTFMESIHIRRRVARTPEPTP